MYEHLTARPLSRMRFIRRMGRHASVALGIIAISLGLGMWGYALYAGLVFIVTAGLLFTPVVHRVLHWFHWGE